MKTENARNSGLALVGLAALLVYILACTSFSPDDKKVLFPSVDPQSTNICVAVYDREAKRTSTVFVPVVYSGTNPSTALVRAAWLDNTRILVAWAPGSEGLNSEALSLAVIPASGGGPLRCYSLPELKSFREILAGPLAVAGQYLLLPGSNAVLRLNLRDGSIFSRDTPHSPEQLMLYPDPSGDGAFYVSEEGDQKVFGKVDVASLTPRPLITFTNRPGDDSFFTYDEKGRRIAFVEDDQAGQHLVVLEAGKPATTRLISPTSRQYSFGSAVFNGRRNVIVAGYLRSDTNNSSLGLLEIPLTGGPVRETVLVPHGGIHSDEGMYFQVGLSHDGKTAAVSSLYALCGSRDLRAEDCALFLVDLSHPQRKITRVPIPLPPKNRDKAT